MTIFNVPPMEGVQLFEISNRTPLSQSAGKRGYLCDNCGISFRSFPSQRRGSTISCSPSCASAFRMVRVPRDCCMCGQVFQVIPSSLKTTCSPKCCRLRRAYDAYRRAPRFDGNMTRSQFCQERGLSRGQFRHRQKVGDLSAKIQWRKPCHDAATGEAWPSLSACAAALGVSVQAVHRSVSATGKLVQGRQITRGLASSDGAA